VTDDQVSGITSISIFQVVVNTEFSTTDVRDAINGNFKTIEGLNIAGSYGNVESTIYDWRLLE
jgi:hypothetical protein